MENPLHDDFAEMRYDLLWLDRSQRSQTFGSRELFTIVRVLCYPLSLTVKTLLVLFVLGLPSMMLSSPRVDNCRSYRSHDYAYSAATSPNGELTASSDDEGVINVRDAASGTTRMTLHEQPCPLGSAQHPRSRESCSPSRRSNLLAFSPNNAVLASARFREEVICPDQSNGRPQARTMRWNLITLWNLNTGHELCAVRGHADEVIAMTFSPNSALLASLSSDQAIKLWDASTGREHFTLRAPGNRMAFTPEYSCSCCPSRRSKLMAFSPDGHSLAAVGGHSAITIWNATTGIETAAVGGVSHRITDMTFSPDGATLAWLDSVQLNLLDLVTGTVRPCADSHWLTGELGGIAFSPDGKSLAVSSGPRAGQWDVSTGAPTGVLEGDNRTLLDRALDSFNVFDDHGYRASERINAVSFTPGGELLASGTLGQSVTLWPVSPFWSEVLSVLQMIFVPLVVLALVVRDIRSLVRRQSRGAVRKGA